MKIKQIDCSEELNDKICSWVESKSYCVGLVMCRPSIKLHEKNIITNEDLVEIMEEFN